MSGGTRYEMGYANGDLNGRGIMEMLEYYAVDYFMTPFLYTPVRAAVLLLLYCPEQLWTSLRA